MRSEKFLFEDAPCTVLDAGGEPHGTLELFLVWHHTLNRQVEHKNSAKSKTNGNIQKCIEIHKKMDKQHIAKLEDRSMTTYDARKSLKLVDQNHFHALTQMHPTIVLST
jgi:hypothetical protein